MSAPRAALTLLAALGAAALLGGCGPRMLEQEGLRPFKRQVPAMPPNLRPYAGPVSPAGVSYSPVPTPAEAAKLQNPVRDDPAAREPGERYYNYYCAMCHGPDGKGQVPVGQSYNPAPTDLTSLAVQGLKDGDYYRAMLCGVGHEPVMAATVAPDRRWPIVTYARTLR